MTAVCHRWEPARYCDALAREVTRFAALARGADPSLPIPTCPDWTVATIVEHVGAVHRWATEHVRTLARERIPGSAIEMGAPDDFAARADWIESWIEPMDATFRDADPDADVWGWGSDKHARFWPRRMLHETAIHRADLAMAVGGDATIEDEVSIDGVDEFLDNLPHARRFAPNVEKVLGSGEALRFDATDAGVVWRISLGPHGFTWEHADGNASVTIEEPASGMALLFYGRVVPDNVGGDETLYARWRANSSI